MTTTTTSKSTKNSTKSKSDRCRELLRAGKTIAELSHDVKLDMGYAFVYGVAKRAGLVEGHAAPKKSANVKINRDDNTVVIHPKNSPEITITVDLITGEVKRTAPRAKSTAKSTK